MQAQVDERAQVFFFIFFFFKENSKDADSIIINTFKVEMNTKNLPYDLDRSNHIGNHKTRKKGQQNKTWKDR